MCNGHETCQPIGGGGTACVAGAPLGPTDFDDHNPCTTDSCSADRGIVNELNPACQTTAGAPPLDNTSSAPFYASTEFLYTGGSPVQTGVAGGTIDPARAAVIRGRVLATDGVTPQAGVTVKIGGHPEYGQTLTRSDGFYDLAVNGGGVLLVNITAAGTLPIQRHAVAKPRDFTVVEDVVLTTLLTSGDTFTPGIGSPQIVRGALTGMGVDADPARRATLYFPANTNFTNFTPPGGPLAIAVTEYTIADGVRRMPGELPPTSGYTYAVELAVPAATAVGIAHPEFDKNVVMYVDNFTGYPVGQTVPLGYYDDVKGGWMGDESGRIVKVSSTSGGLANLIITSGAGEATPSELAAIGIDADERAALASEFPVGTELWRSRMSHFSAWDANWGFSPPPGAEPPPTPDPKANATDDDTKRCGSIIGCESRTLGERIPIVGTPYTLHYQSERSAGYLSQVSFRVTGNTVLNPAPLRIHVEIDVAGRRFAYEKLPPFALDDTFTFTWDGVDAYGRQVTGTFEAKIRVGYEYDGTTTGDTPIFGVPAGTTISGNRAARTATIWKEAIVPFTRADAKPLGFGGWTIDVNHLVDNYDTLFLGDGGRRRIAWAYQVDNFAGGGVSGAENIPATQAAFADNIDFVRAPDGSVYVAEGGQEALGGRIRRIAPDGIITTVAGLAPVVTRSDGMPALHAQVWPNRLAVGPDGSIYFSEATNGLTPVNGVWKIDPGSTPNLHHVAGTGAAGSANECTLPPPGCGDGGAATAASVRQPRGLAVASDGAVFIADVGHDRVRRVGPEGIITTYFAGSTGTDVWNVSLREDGTLFVLNTVGQKLTRIEPDGRPFLVSTSIHQDWCDFASTGSVHALGDDSFFVSCYPRLVKVTPEGSLLRLAGPADNPFGLSDGDGGPALRAVFAELDTIAVAGRDILVAETFPRRLRRLRVPFGTSDGVNVHVPSEDGREVYELDLAGRHLRTLSGLKGTPLLTFGYDATTKQLTSIIDVASNVTTIARPTASQVVITAPRGQVTTLALDANGYLASITNPVTTEITQLAATTSGLLTELVDPRGHAHHFEYSGDGRLLKDVDATPGSPGTRLMTTSDGNGWSVTLSSPEGRVTNHRVDLRGSFDSAIRERRTITKAGPALASVVDTLVDEATAASYPDGTKVTVTETAADPRWGTAASFAKSLNVEIGYPATTHAMTTTETRSATLAAPGDPFSVTSQTITSTRAASGLPSAVTTSVFSAGPPAKWTTTSPAGRVVEVTLDNLERVTAVTVLGSSPVTLHPVQFSYDGQGRVDLVTWGSRTYGTSYDPTSGWIASTTAPEGLGVTFDSRDANGRPLLTTLPGGRQLATSYDLSGNLISIAPPSQPAHAFSFDPNDRLSLYEPPDGTPSLNPKDTSYTRDFDGLTLLSSHPNKPVSYGYDPLGRLAQTSAAVTTTFGRDAQGRVSTIATSDGVTLTNTWDGSLLAQQDVSGPFAHYVHKTYDNFLRVSSWDIDGASPISLVYDGDDLVTSAGGMTLTWSTNGLLTSTSVGGVGDTFTPNAFGEIVGHSISGSATAYGVTYERDGAGRIHKKTETVGAITHVYDYEYDAAGRLWKVYVDSPTPTRTWTYDDNGNRSDGTHDDQDRLLTQGNFAFQYGNNGELSKKSTIAPAATVFDYVYDAHGNLRTAVRAAPFETIHYVVDGQDRRVGKKYGATLVQGFLYDGRRIVAELNGLGAVVSRFVYATQSHSPDLMIKAGTTYRIVKDHLGSPLLVVNASTGAVVQTIAYDEWGNATESGTEPLPFGFAGGLWDRDTGLVRFGARDYDPSTGRWTSKDANRFTDGSNFYAYVNDDPINFIDPTGHYAVPLVIAGVAILAAVATYVVLDNAAQQDVNGWPSFPHMPYDPVMPLGGPTTAPPWDLPSPPIPDTADAPGEGTGILPATEHTKNKRPSTKGKHQKGKSRKQRDCGGESGDDGRRPNRRRPDGWKGPWPPR
ncbi:MAG: hypothetical protein KIS78_06165 [Labilithrix sp.]|nr:hypothetical protein [Labilithrix sp.]